MRFSLPEKLNEFAKSCPFKLYLVGGAVRDGLAGFSTEKPDYDLCAPVSAETFIRQAEKAGAEIKSIYRNTGTVKFMLGGTGYEFASFRSDEYVRGVHRPVNTFFTDDITLDARRRDFKCNAVYYDIAADEICDPLGGADDIKNAILNTVAPAKKVFGEDGLRLMRLARVAAQTGFTPSKECLSGAAENAALILDVAPQRVFAELDMLLLSDVKYGISGGQFKGLNILDDTRVLDFVIPELAAGRGVKQRADFHKYDVLGHSLRAALYADPAVRWAALLHDVGKSVCFARSGNFHGHEEVGEKIVTEILTRLTAPAALRTQTARLTALHMYDFDLRAGENKVRRFIVREYDLLDKLLMLKQADFSACTDDISTAPVVTKWQHILQKMRAENVPFTLKDLKIKGDELIALGIPRENISTALKTLLSECVNQPELNEKPKLAKRAVSLFC